jgi:hypothetical protein
MIIVWMLVGGVVGAANSLMRWWTVSKLQSNMRPGPLTLLWGGLTLRMALVTGLLMLGLKQGIVPGLLAFAGLSVVRWGSVIWFGAVQTRRDRPVPASSAR